MAAAAAASSSSSGPSTNAASAQEPPIIGFEGDKAKIIDAMLDSSHPELSFIAITGEEGVGKTTLAREIYTSAELQEFDVHIWVFEAADTFDEMNRQILGVDSSRTKREDLQKHLNGKRYCLVIDNCWVSDNHKICDWDEISEALPGNENGSRVLLICSATKVEVTTPEVLICHEVDCRSEEGSMDILLKAANLNLPAINTMPGMLDLLRNYYLPLCQGLPWPLRFMGSLLSMLAPNLQSWTDFHQTIAMKYPTYNDFVSKLAMKLRQQDFSYRAAFLSFLTYPPNAHIHVQTLFLKWITMRIAEDEIAAGCMLDDFVRKSIVQVAERLINGRLVKVCQMVVDPLVRALAVQEAKEKRYVRVCPNRWEVIYRDLFSPHVEVDRAMVGDDFSAKMDVTHLYDATCGIFNWSSETDTVLSWSGVLEVNNSQTMRDVERTLMKMESPRYLGLRNSGLLPQITNVVGLLDRLDTLVVEGTPLETLPPDLLSKTMQLEHLILSDTKLQEIPLSIQKLKFLKTLNVSGAPIRTLPDYMRQLIYLQTLDIRDTFIRSIPRSVWTQLRFVFASGCIEYLDGPPSSLNNGMLVTLTTVNVLKTWKKNAVPKLPALRELGLSNYIHARIHNLEKHWRPVFNLLRTLSALSSLKLQGSHIPADIIHVDICPSYMYKLTQLWVGGSQSLFSLHDITMPPCLTNLTLENLEFEEDPMPMLGKLQILKILQLRCLLLDATPAARKMTCSSDSFPRLEELGLCHLTGLEEWLIEEGAMPKLIHVLIRNCKKLKKLPDSLLQQRETAPCELHLYSMPSAFTEHLSQLPFVKITNNRNQLIDPSCWASSLS